MIEGSSGESDVSGEAPSIRLTISRIFKRFHHFYRLTDISAFLNEGFFILQDNLHQDSPPSDGPSRFPFLHPILLWVEHGQLLHDHHLPGLVKYISKISTNQLYQMANIPLDENLASVLVAAQYVLGYR